jgi:hypothetical protein
MAMNNQTPDAKVKKILDTYKTRLREFMSSPSMEQDLQNILTNRGPEGAVSSKDKNDLNSLLDNLLPKSNIYFVDYEIISEILNVGGTFATMSNTFSITNNAKSRKRTSTLAKRINNTLKKSRHNNLFQSVMSILNPNREAQEILDKLKRIKEFEKYNFMYLPISKIDAHIKKLIKMCMLFDEAKLEIQREAAEAAENKKFLNDIKARLRALKA